MSNRREKSGTVVVEASATPYREELVGALRRGGLDCVAVDQSDNLLDPPPNCIPNLILLGLPSANGPFQHRISHLRHQLPLTDVVAFARETRPAQVAEAFRAGVSEFLIGEDPREFVDRVQDLVAARHGLGRLQRLREQLAQNWRFEGFISRSQSMWDVFETVERVAWTNATVLIEGETGTGKELLARAIHHRSRRHDQTFLAVNCGAMTETLLDSELFGHERGAFTGASSQKIGLLEHCNGGTLLLDEIGNISESMQKRLLRFLETGNLRRVGGTREIASDVRVVAATNQNLKDAVEEASFRKDLFYRLNVIRLALPPLRERPEDVLLLFNHFVKVFADKYEVSPPRVSGKVVDLLLSHTWPGNVRELINLTERLLLVSREEITAESIPWQTPLPDNALESDGPMVADISRPLPEALEMISTAYERDYLRRLLQKHGGRIQRCARHAGINRRTLYRKMKQYGLDKEEFKKK